MRRRVALDAEHIVVHPKALHERSACLPLGYTFRVVLPFNDLWDQKVSNDLPGGSGTLSTGAMSILLFRIMLSR